MRYEHLLVGRDETGIGTIVMNRPERRNALSEAHMQELLAAFRELGDAPDTRAVILGANGPVFSAGHDFGDMAERDLAGMRKLVAICTLAVAADTAAFATPGGRGGWFCHTPGVAVARSVSRKQALEMLLI